MPRLTSAVCAGIHSFSLASTLAAQSYSFPRFAGTNGGAAYQDGAGTAARLTLPQSVAVDKNGIVYVGENDTLRRISASGNVTTLAGINMNVGLEYSTRGEDEQPSQILTGRSICWKPHRGSTIGRPGA